MVVVVVVVVMGGAWAGKGGGGGLGIQGLGFPTLLPTGSPLDTYPKPMHQQG